MADSINRELEEELVPEWRAKYLDYKVLTINCPSTMRSSADA